MYFNTAVESLHNEILLNGILISWAIVLTSLAAVKSASNSSLRIVNESLFIGVNLDFANTKLQISLPLLIAFYRPLLRMLFLMHQQIYTVLQDL